MYENQSRVAENAVRKQAYIDTLVAGDEAWARDYGLTGEALERQRLVGAYHFYLGGLVEKYGISRVIDLYDGTTDVSELANVRTAKRSYCELMLEDSPLLSRLFGLELGICATARGIMMWKTIFTVFMCSAVLWAWGC